MENRKSSILLKKLVLKDAQAFYDLQAYPELCGSAYQEFYSPDEKPEEFTKRLLWLSKCIYTIRLKTDPNKIIGACMIYKSGKFKKDAYLGGTLLPQYRGEGLLFDAFNEMLEIANYFYGIYEVKMVLNALNEHVLQFVKKLGFSEDKKAREKTYIKTLRQYKPQRDNKLLYLY